MATIDRRSTTRRRFSWPLLVFLGPAVLTYSAFMVFPLFDSLRLSLFSPGGSRLGVFVGLQNYVTLLTDPLWSPRFWGRSATTSCSSRSTCSCRTRSGCSSPSS